MRASTLLSSRGWFDPMLKSDANCGVCRLLYEMIKAVAAGEISLERDWDLTFDHGGAKAFLPPYYQRLHALHGVIFYTNPSQLFCLAA